MKPSAIHRGNQDRVLAAIRAGNRTFQDVKRVTGLDDNAVRTSLTRLSDRRLITRNNGLYTPVEKCLLAEVWR